MIRNEVALVDESRCIGCTLCIAACPVDAIVGAQTLMHTVVEPWCIGCRLCVPPCPVDCIAMIPASGPLTAVERSSTKARARARKRRLASRIAPVEKKDRAAILAAALARKTPR